MTDLTAFPITQKWPAQHPDRLQLYSLPTPNGVKVSIMLEEIGLPYEPHLVSFDSQDQMSPAFLSLNPNNKIPAILDPDGPDGRPLPLFESGAILYYLAEKTGQLLPRDAAARYETLQWLMFQMGGVRTGDPARLGTGHAGRGRRRPCRRPRDRGQLDHLRAVGRRAVHGRHAHAPQSERRYVEVRLAQLPVLHLVSLLRLAYQPGRGRGECPR